MEKERSAIMPLTMMDAGIETTVKTIRGKDQTKKFLQNLGFVEGARVSVVSSLSGNLIVQVLDARVALSQSMASRIMV
ncbi:MAG: ferrous iron transport protein A [Agathobaculum sp.]|nr:ferrous iron transport protein A [Agathobaculum sp.]